ncbi:hypothetical protein IJI99_02890, partial [bacterium]|nr:hypothetical protein [bacterium]
MSKMEDAFGKVLDKYYLMVCIAYRDCNIEKLSTLALDIIIILEQEMGYSSGALDGLLYGASDL